MSLLRTDTTEAIVHRADCCDDDLIADHGQPTDHCPPAVATDRHRSLSTVSARSVLLHRALK